MKEVSFRSDHVKKRAVRVAFKLRLGRYLRSSFPPLSLLLTSSSSSSVVSSSNRVFDGASPSRLPIEAWCSPLLRTKSATFSPSLFGENTAQQQRNDNNNDNLSPRKNENEMKTTTLSESTSAREFLFETEVRRVFFALVVLRLAWEWFWW